MGLKCYVVLQGLVAVTVLSFQWLEPDHWLLISGIKGIKVELMEMCQVVHRATTTLHGEVTPKFFRRLEGPQVYQPASPCVFLLIISFNH